MLIYVEKKFIFYRRKCKQKSQAIYATIVNSFVILESNFWNK